MVGYFSVLKKSIPKSSLSLISLSVSILLTLIDTFSFAFRGSFSETLKVMSKSLKKPLVSFKPSMSKLISALVGSILLLVQVVFKIEAKSCVFISSIFVFLSSLSGLPQLEKIKMPINN